MPSPKNGCPICGTLKTAHAATCRPCSFRPALARFAEKLGSPTATGCIPWIANCYPAGHGQFHFDGKPILAHRFAYLELVGEIPSGKVLHHLCGNPACCNVAHLVPVTRAEHNAIHGSPMAARTRCKHGHEFTPENTAWRVRKSGARYRECRRCMRRRHADHLARLAA